MRNIVTVTSFKNIKSVKFKVKYFDANYDQNDDSTFMTKEFNVNDSEGRSDFITKLFAAMYYLDVVAIKLVNKLNAVFSTCYLHVVDDVEITYTDGTVNTGYDRFTKLVGDVLYGEE